MLPAAPGHDAGLRLNVLGEYRQRPLLGLQCLPTPPLGDHAFGVETDLQVVEAYAPFRSVVPLLSGPAVTVFELLATFAGARLVAPNLLAAGRIGGGT